MGLSESIDSLQGIPANAGFADLHYHFRTGRAVYISGTGRDKRYEYRSGMETDLGDIEASVWKDAVYRLIHQAKEDLVYQVLLAYVTAQYPWCHTKQERELEALNLHCSRIFENSEWVDRDLFWKVYYPKSHSPEGGF